MIFNTEIPITTCKTDLTILYKCLAGCKKPANYELRKP
jgi:hypothetical protein